SITISSPLSNIFQSIRNSAITVQSESTSYTSIQVNKQQVEKYVNYLLLQPSLPTPFTRDFSPLNFSSTCAELNFLFLFGLVDNCNNPSLYQLPLSRAQIVLGCIAI